MFSFLWSKLTGADRRDVEAILLQRIKILEQRASFEELLLDKHEVYHKRVLASIKTEVDNHYSYFVSVHRQNDVHRIATGKGIQMLAKRIAALEEALDSKDHLLRN